MASADDRVVSVTLVVATIAVASSVVYRTVAPVKSSSSQATEKPSFEASWTDALALGATIMGNDTSPITVLELTDLECPACRGYHPRLKQLVARHPRDVRVVYVAYPLTIHRFAMGAANAGDCALDLGPSVLARWVEVMYAGQDSLGLRSWGSFAKAAEIVDTATIGACATNPAGRPRVDSSLAFGKRLEVNGTPTLIVNGWLFRGLPTDKALDELIATLLREKSASSTAR